MHIHGFKGENLIVSLHLASPKILFWQKKAEKARIRIGIYT
jgi:hypothetical protein